MQLKINNGIFRSLSDYGQTFVVMVVIMLSVMLLLKFKTDMVNSHNEF